MFIINNSCIVIITTVMSIVQVPYSPFFGFGYFLFFGTIQFLFMSGVSKFTFLQEKKEGFYRFSLARLKEYSEQVAIYKGINKEKEIILNNFDNLLKNQFWLIINKTALSAYYYLVLNMGIMIFIFYFLFFIFFRFNYCLYCSFIVNLFWFF
jgi:ABC-type uncharacterized transport system fused permease/ATPase subunit